MEVMLSELRTLPPVSADCPVHSVITPLGRRVLCVPTFGGCYLAHGNPNGDDRYALQGATIEEFERAGYRVSNEAVGLGKPWIFMTWLPPFAGRK